MSPFECQHHVEVTWVKMCVGDELLRTALQAAGVTGHAALTSKTSGYKFFHTRRLLKHSLITKAMIYLVNLSRANFL